MSFLKFCYYKFTTDSFRRSIDFQRRKYWYKKYTVIKDFYKNSPITDEQRHSLSYLHRHRFNLDGMKVLYVSSIVEQYQKKIGHVPVMYDRQYDLPYVMHYNKRLYFKRGLADDFIEHLYVQFLSEMDSASPHVYCKNPEELDNRILFDCGVAEGLFPLTYIERFSKIILFECDEGWVEALNATFAPYSSKVSIVCKCVSDVTNESSISIDDYCNQYNIIPSFLKMDIEGYEEQALIGSKHVLSQSDDMICSICTYHKPTSEFAIVDYMSILNYVISYNNGYMIFDNKGEFEPPYLRRGVVRFTKSE